jgi:hypothetical protein
LGFCVALQSQRAERMTPVPTYSAVCARSRARDNQVMNFPDEERVRYLSAQDRPNQTPRHHPRFDLNPSSE